MTSGPADAPPAVRPGPGARPLSFRSLGAPPPGVPRVPSPPIPATHAPAGFAILRLDGEVLYSSDASVGECRNTSRAAIATAFADRVWTDRSQMRAHLDRAHACGEAQEEFAVLEDDGGWGRLTLRTCRLDVGSEALLLIAHVTEADAPVAPPVRRRPVGAASESPGGGISAEATAILDELVEIDGRLAVGAGLDPAAMERLIARITTLRDRVADLERAAGPDDDPAPLPSFAECVRAGERLRRAMDLVGEIAADLGDAPGAAR